MKTSLINAIEDPVAKQLLKEWRQTKKIDVLEKRMLEKAFGRLEKAEKDMCALTFAMIAMLERGLPERTHKLLNSLWFKVLKSKGKRDVYKNVDGIIDRLRKRYPYEGPCSIKVQLHSKCLS